MSIPHAVKAPRKALADSAPLRYITFAVLYFSQGIPEGITIFAIPAWMAMQGKNALDIAAYSAVIIIPFSLKILLAPIMERYVYLPMGRRRPWMLFGQLGIVCCLVAMAMIPDPLNQIPLLTTVALCLHVCIMFQDIATDSLVIDIVPIEQQGRANSLMWGSKTIGTSVALFAGSAMINQFGLSTAAMVMASLIFLVMFLPLLLREQQGEKMLPWTLGKTSPVTASMIVDSWKKLFTSFVQVIKLRNSILLFITVYSLMVGIHYLTTSLPVFTIQELHWNNIDYSNTFALFSLIGGIFGMVIGGIIIHRFGIIRLLRGTLICIILLAVIMASSMSLWQQSDWITAYIGVFCVLRTLIYIGVLALAMHLCWRRISAVQFTFSMTIFNLGLSSGAALLGYVRSIADWQMIFIGFAVLITCSGILLSFIKTNRHLEQVELLEKNYLGILETEGSLLVRSETN